MQLTIEELKIVLQALQQVSVPVPKAKPVMELYEKIKAEIESSTR